MSVQTQKKMWFIIHVNEPHLPLDFCACALDNKLMAVYSRNTTSAKAVFPVRFPTQARESAFLHPPCVHRKGSQIKKKKVKEKQWNPWRFSHYFEWQKSQLGRGLFNILPQCPKQMVLRSVQRCDFVTQVKPNRSLAIDGYLERRVNFQRCVLPVS